VLIDEHAEGLRQVAEPQSSFRIGKITQESTMRLS
jgi:hypothetical protein